MQLWHSKQRLAKIDFVNKRRAKPIFVDISLITDKFAVN